MHEKKKSRVSERKESSSPDLISDLPDDITDQILNCLPPKDAGKTRLLSKTWQTKWSGWIQSHGDRITTLPSNVTSQILSCLPTNVAMRTSVLSQCWRNRWTSVNNIDVDTTSVPIATDFVNFMTWILLRTSNTRLRSFRLSYNKVTCPKSFKPLEIWIREIFRRNIPYVSIEAAKVRMYCSSSLLFSGWTSLTGLKLALSCSLELPAAVTCLPNLKSLSLGTGHRTSGFVTEIMKISAKQSLNTGKIELHFPVLEVLELFMCKWLDVERVNIHAPKLICFNTCCLHVLQNYKIEINAPALVEFEAVFGLINIVLRAPSLTDATFIMHRMCTEYITPKNPLKACKMLKNFLNLKSLTLSGNMIVELIESDPELVLPGIKEFKLCSGTVCTEVLMDMLRVLPSLEMLSMNLMDWNYYVHNKSIRVPPCIASHLTEVKFTNYYDTPGLLALAKLIVQNARNLKNLLVQVRAKKFTHIRSELKKAKPKGSRGLIVVQKQRYDEED